MTQASADKPIAYRLAVGASVALSLSWLVYLAYLSGTVVTKQSVYMGAITFYAALLLAVSALLTGLLIGAIGYLAKLRHQLAKPAAIWGASALMVVLLVFAITRPMINNAN